jgi:hypothetical protein
MDTSNPETAADSPQKSWVIWLRDGRYSYAWGENETVAKLNWLMAFLKGVVRIVPAGEYKSALPVELYLREISTE